MSKIKYITNQNCIHWLLAFACIFSTSTLLASSETEEIFSDHNKLLKHLERALSLNELGTVYCLLSQDYKDRIGADIFGSLLERRGFRVSEANIEKVVKYDDWGYCIVSMKYSLDGRRYSGFEVVFMSKKSDKWFIENIPLSNMPTLGYPYGLRM